MNTAGGEPAHADIAGINLAREDWQSPKLLKVNALFARLDLCGSSISSLTSRINISQCAI